MPGSLVEGALAERPAVIVAVVLCWALVGLLTAALTARRGHAFRPLGGLGVAFGPLLLGFVLATLLTRERASRPLVIREAKAHGGDQDVVIAVLGPPDEVVDAIPVLRLSGSSLGRVDLVRPVTYDAAEAPEQDPDRRDATQELEVAALFLHEFAPGLVLVPGRGATAVDEYLGRRDVDLVLVSGDRKSQDELSRKRRRRAVTVMLGAPRDQAERPE